MQRITHALDGVLKYADAPQVNWAAPRVQQELARIERLVQQVLQFKRKDA